MKKRLFLLMAAFACLPLLANIYNVREFGAKGDGKTLDHTAINQAIETATTHGGGQVVLPAGTYLCGSIRLKSHVDGLRLHHVRFELIKPDDRPEMLLEDVSNQLITE